MTAIADTPTFVAHLECAYTGDRFPADTIHGLSPEGKPMLVQYDLDGVSSSVTKDDLASRPDGMWRYREFLPVRHTENVVSLAETQTPLVPLPAMEQRLGATSIVMKDEGRLPTGSFKARGLVHGGRRWPRNSASPAWPCRPTAMPARRSRPTPAAPACETYVFCPADTPEVNVREIALQGAKVWRVNGLIDDCGKIVGAGKERHGLVRRVDPARSRTGSKARRRWVSSWPSSSAGTCRTSSSTRPAAAPASSACGRPSRSCEAMGWIGAKRPRMVAVQATGCAPIVRAYNEGERHARRWENAHTIASGIRVPVAVGDFLILEAVRESGGFAIAVTDEAIAAAHREVPQTDGLLICPEGAATVAAYETALEQGLVDRNERAVLFNCGSGLKYPMPPADASIDKDAPIDWEAMALA